MTKRILLAGAAFVGVDSRRLGCWRAAARAAGLVWRRSLVGRWSYVRLCCAIQRDAFSGSVTIQIDGAPSFITQSETDTAHNLRAAGQHIGQR